VYLRVNPPLLVNVTRGLPTCSGQYRQLTPPDDDPWFVGSETAEQTTGTEETRDGPSQIPLLVDVIRRRDAEFDRVSVARNESIGDAELAYAVLFSFLSITTQIRPRPVMIAMPPIAANAAAMARPIWRTE